MGNSWSKKIKFFIKIALASSIYYLGIFHFLKFLRRKKPTVLCYHRIVENFYEENEYSQGGLLVSKDSFKRQIDFIKRQYNAISMDDFIAHLEGKAKLPNYSLLITFDDGYKDNFQVAYPILKNYGVPATIFITTDFIDGYNYPSWEKERNDNEKLMLSWQEIGQMSEDSISFGAHIKTHKVYGLEELDSHIYDEIKESKEIIENKIKKEVKTFAFPKGEYDQKAIEQLQKNGYKCAFSLNRKNDMPEYKNFIFERIPVNEGMYIGENGIFHLPIFACGLLNFWKKY